MSVTGISEWRSELKINTEQEEHLLNQADQLIGRFGVKKALTICASTSIKDFKDALEQADIALKIGAFVAHMNNSSISEIISMAVDSHSYSSDLHYRSTFCQDVLEEKKNVFCRGDIGKQFLQEIAKAVLIAAMYDILMTEFHIKSMMEGRADGDHIVFEPKQMMTLFVREVRFHEFLV